MCAPVQNGARWPLRGHAHDRLNPRALDAPSRPEPILRRLSTSQPWLLHCESLTSRAPARLLELFSRSEGYEGPKDVCGMLSATERTVCTTGRGQGALASR